MATHEITRGRETVPRREASQAFHTKLLNRAGNQSWQNFSTSQRCRPSALNLEFTTLRNPETRCHPEQSERSEGSLAHCLRRTVMPTPFASCHVEERSDETSAVAV